MNVQKSADGIVAECPSKWLGLGEGLNLRQRARRLCLRDGATPDKSAVMIWRQSNVASFEVTTGVVTLYAREAPHADPHAGCCGEGGLETHSYPIRFLFHYSASHFPLYVST